MSDNYFTASVHIPVAKSGVRLVGAAGRPEIEIGGPVEVFLSIDQADTLARNLTIALARARAIEDL